VLSFTEQVGLSYTLYKSVIRAKRTIVVICLRVVTAENVEYKVH